MNDLLALRKSLSNQLATRQIVFIAIVLTTFLSGCRSAPMTGRKQLLFVPEQTELTQGLSAYQEVLSKEPPSQNQAVIEAVQRVGNRIAAVSGRPDYQWEFRVIKSDTQNAFCLPGGKVAVYEGILPICQTEAGLAVVMSHEVAHALARHGGERMSQNAAVGAAKQALSYVTSSQAAVKQQLFMQAYGLGSQYGLLLPYSRQHELEADQIGLMLMAKAGYDPSEAPKFWERFGSVGGQKPMEFMSTHPSDQRRVTRLLDALPQAQEAYAMASEKIGIGQALPLSDIAEVPSAEPVGETLR